MTFDYYEVEDRIYRVPAKGDPRRMEKWSPEGQRWVRYDGDFAAVLVNGARLHGEPDLP